jgi:hypothetical protein
MAIYEILNKEGKVINRIIAEPDFVEKKYPGLYRDITPEPEIVIEEEKAPVKTLEEKVDELTAKIDALTATISKGV